MKAFIEKCLTDNEATRCPHVIHRQDAESIYSPASIYPPPSARIRSEPCGPHKRASITRKRHTAIASAREEPLGIPASVASSFERMVLPRFAASTRNSRSSVWLRRRLPQGPQSIALAGVKCRPHDRCRVHARARTRAVISAHSQGSTR